MTPPPPTPALRATQATRFLLTEQREQEESMPYVTQSPGTLVPDDF